MKKLLIGSPDSNVPFHVRNVIEETILTEYNKYQSTRLYFLDHRKDNRKSIMNHLIEIDTSYDDLDISYKITMCSLVIMTELIDDLLIDSRGPYHSTRIILYFNLDSITSSNPNILTEIFNKLDIVSETLPISLICLSTRQILDRVTLARFDSIHVFKDTSPTSLQPLIDYLNETSKFSDYKLLQKMIALLSTDSEKSIEIKDIPLMTKHDITNCGRIVIT